MNSRRFDNFERTLDDKMKMLLDFAHTVQHRSHEMSENRTVVTDRITF